MGGHFHDYTLTAESDANLNNSRIAEKQCLSRAQRAMLAMGFGTEEYTPSLPTIHHPTLTSYRAVAAVFFRTPKDEDALRKALAEQGVRGIQLRRRSSAQS